MSKEAMTIWIDPKTGDIEVDPETGFVTLVTGPDEIEQAVRRRLSTWEGEWFWDRRFGVPWQEFGGKNASLARLQLELLLELHRERRIERLLYLGIADYDPQTRTVTVLFVGTFDNEIVKLALRQEV